jgi:5,10-methylenetetrahydrofolate reductase
MEYHFVPHSILTTLLENGSLLPSVLHLPTLDDRPQQLKATINQYDNLYIDDVLVLSSNNAASNGFVNIIEGCV